ncbi:interferon-induced transmembrane protein 1-like [Heteronotia binoei]|uniref:interferon-induced transmembrane protein 1-like n=1 Tax=Heteronotia binoei TaxID=13085 RepID=UPI00292F4E9E|nr:interferon-induced transmembrane protein 1-like [Heteronotia binoei]
MASGAQYPFLGNAPLSRYEQLKEEQELTPIEANVPVATTVVHMGPPLYVTPASDHIVWSLFTTKYFNFCCLGVMALAFSVKARDRKVVGDHSGASSYGSTARCLNITALVLSLLFITIAITVTVYYVTRI